MHPMRPVRMTPPSSLALSGLLSTGSCTRSRFGRHELTDRPELRSGPQLERVSPQDAARLRRVVEPLAKAADRPPAKVTIGILSDPSINAANAGNGEFYVTRGLLNRASDRQLRAIMAHEFAHNDLGHVAKAQPPPGRGRARRRHPGAGRPGTRRSSRPSQGR